MTSREHPEEGIPSRPGVERINQRSLTSRYAPEEGINHWKGATIGRKEPSAIETKEATFCRRLQGSNPLPSIPRSQPEVERTHGGGGVVATHEGMPLQRMPWCRRNQRSRGLSPYHRRQGTTQRSSSPRSHPESTWCRGHPRMRSPGFQPIETKAFTFSRRREGSTLLPVIPGSAPSRPRKQPSAVSKRERWCVADTHMFWWCRHAIDVKEATFSHRYQGVNQRWCRRRTQTLVVPPYAHRYRGANPRPSTPRHQPMVGWCLQDGMVSTHDGTLHP